jgi:hypothetical protein
MIQVANNLKEAYILFNNGANMICCENRFAINDRVRSYQEAEIFFKKFKKKIRNKVRPIKTNKL